MRRLVTTIATLSLLTAACAGSDDSGSDSVTDTAAPATEPPATEPPATEPPATEPPATEPPATDAPSSTEPPATEPPATDAPASTEAPLEVSEPALPDFSPAARGPYEVGVQTITINSATDRPLTTEVWFPVAEGTEGDPHRYTFITGDYYESPDAITADASAISPDGPFPLVAFSHGSGGVRYQTSFLTEFLASHGYLVAAPEHTGNTAVDRVLAAAEAEAGTEPTEEDLLTQRQEIALNRVLDIQNVITAFLDPESTETVGFVGSVNPQQIAVSGHSFGGFTSYAVVSGYDNALGAAQPDLRVSAIVPLAPAVGDGSLDGLLSDERLASVDVPALVMVGTNDQTTPADPNVDRAFGLGASDPSYRVDLVDAQHQSFSDACDYLASVPLLENPTPAVVDVIEDLAAEGCSPGDMPIERVKELTTTFALSFLESVFADGEMLTPETVAIPTDVIFASK